MATGLAAGFGGASNACCGRNGGLTGCGRLWTGRLSGRPRRGGRNRRGSPGRCASRWGIGVATAGRRRLDGTVKRFAGQKRLWRTAAGVRQPGAGLPYSAQSVMAGNGWMMSGLKTGILVAFVLTALFIHRPWCRMLCPRGRFLAWFNRHSVFPLRFEARQCVECNLCRSRCSRLVRVDEPVNVTSCIRCLECTTCGAIQPAFALPATPTPASPAAPPARPNGQG